MANQMFTMGDDGDFIMEPGARLEVGPKGTLYETTGDFTDELRKSYFVDETGAPGLSEQPLSGTDEESAARRELARMNGQLKKWLKFRRINDEVASGQRKAKVPTSLAAATLGRDRYWEGEQDLADDLYALLSELHDPQALPSPDVSRDPNAAVKLATIAITGELGSDAASPQASGILPLLILTVGGVVLFSITSSIRNRAAAQAESERIKCIQDGACTDFGFWLKVASIGVIGWFAWDKLGLRERAAKLKRSM